VVLFNRFVVCYDIYKGRISFQIKAKIFYWRFIVKLNKSRVGGGGEQNVSSTR
jgi:hypothetical protein